MILFGCMIAYIFGGLFAALPAIELGQDGWGIAARIALWPAFAVKGAIKVCRAGWREFRA